MECLILLNSNMKGMLKMEVLDSFTTESIMNMARWDGQFIKPIDSLIFTEEGANKAINFWKGFTHETPPDGILADILMAGICPVFDVLLETETPKMLGDVLYGRVMIFPDLVERVVDLTGELYIGVLLLYTERIKVVLPFKVSETQNTLVFDDTFGVVSDDPNEVEFYKNNPELIDQTMIKKNTKFYMELWYGIMWVILNPMTRVIVRKNKEEYDTIPVVVDHEEAATPEITTNTTIKYVKTKVITSEDFDKCADKIAHTIHKDCWYVTGHYREQPTKKGIKRIYIKPYWKGPMRELKIHDTRNRELVYNENGEEHE